MFKFTVIPFSAVPCRQFRPPGRDIPLTVIDYTLSMCGFPDKKTRFVLTKNPSHKSRYYNFFLAGIPKRINRLPGCCLVSRIQTKITPIIRDMVLVTPGMASMISDWSTMEKASSSCSKRSIRSSVSAFSVRSRLPVPTIVLERFPFSPLPIAFSLLFSAPASYAPL